MLQRQKLFTDPRSRRNLYPLSVVSYRYPVPSRKAPAGACQLPGTAFFIAHKRDGLDLTFKAMQTALCTRLWLLALRPTYS